MVSPSSFFSLETPRTLAPGYLARRLFLTALGRVTDLPSFPSSSCARPTVENAKSPRMAAVVTHRSKRIVDLRRNRGGESARPVRGPLWNEETGEILTPAPKRMMSRG